MDRNRWSEFSTEELRAIMVGHPLAEVVEIRSELTEELKARGVTGLKPYTVIGQHEDSGEIFTESVMAEDPHEAIRAVARAKSYADAEILGAIEGTHQMVTACEDARTAAHVSDLVDDEDDDEDKEEEEAEEYSCPKCGTVHYSDVFVSQGEGEESEKFFFYCSERCMVAH